MSPPELVNLSINAIYGERQRPRRINHWNWSSDPGLIYQWTLRVFKLKPAKTNANSIRVDFARKGNHQSLVERASVILGYNCCEIKVAARSPFLKKNVTTAATVAPVEDPMIPIKGPCLSRISENNVGI